MKVRSFIELKPLRDKMFELREAEDKKNEEIWRLERLKKRAEELLKDKCNFCGGAGVKSNQGADVCCPVCQGRS